MSCLAVGPTSKHQLGQRLPEDVKGQGIAGAVWSYLSICVLNCWYHLGTWLTNANWKIPKINGELLVITRLGTSKSMGVQYSNGLTWMILMIIFGVPPEELRIEYVNRIRVTRQSTPLNFIPGQKELENHQTNDKINKLLLKLVLLPVFFKRALDC